MGERGAIVVDPVVIPRLGELLSTRGGGANAGRDDAWQVYFNRGTNAPYASREQMVSSPEFARVNHGHSLPPRSISAEGLDYRQAREELMVSYLKLMADHNLDAIVYKSRAFTHPHQ